jgi:hypothetical protein
MSSTCPIYSEFKLHRPANKRIHQRPAGQDIQKWDGNRAVINYVLRNFRRWLIENKIKEKLELQSRQRDLLRLKNKHSNDYYNNNSGTYYGRLEKLFADSYNGPPKVCMLLAAVQILDQYQTSGL